MELKVGPAEDGHAPPAKQPKGGRNLSPLRAGLRPLLPGQSALVRVPADSGPKETQIRAAQVAHLEWGKGNYRTALGPDGVRVWRLR